MSLLLNKFLLLFTAVFAIWNITAEVKCCRIKQASASSIILLTVKHLAHITFTGDFLLDSTFNSFWFQKATSYLTLYIYYDFYVLIILENYIILMFLLNAFLSVLIPSLFSWHSFLFLDISSRFSILIFFVDGMGFYCCLIPLLMKWMLDISFVETFCKLFRQKSYVITWFFLFKVMSSLHS